MTAKHGLFVAGSTGGVTSPKEARLALAGLLSASGAGPLDATAGVLYGPGSPCNVTGSSSGPNMKYTVAAGPLATARGTSADGLTVWANDGALTLDSGSPAPGSGTRWDLVWARHKDAYGSDGFGDANSDPEFGVTVGTAGASPSKPYASVPAGAVVLAECSVGTNIANASLATITQVAPWKTTRGAPIPVRSQAERDALTQYVGLHVLRLDAGGIQEWSNGTAWTRYQTAADTGWVNITALQSGWTQDSQSAQARQIGNKVWLRGGLVDNIFATTSFLTAATLPASIARPPGTVVYPMFGGTTSRGLRILNTGEIQCYATPASTFAFRLDHIDYLTD